MQSSTRIEIADGAPFSCVSFIITISKSLTLARRHPFVGKLDDMPSKIEMFDIVYIFYSNLQLRKKYTEFYITLPKKTHCLLPTLSFDSVEDLTLYVAST